MRRHDVVCAALGAWCEEMGCNLEAGARKTDPTERAYFDGPLSSIVAHGIRFKDSAS